MKSVLFVAFLCFSTFAAITAKRFDKCSFAHEMSQLGIPWYELPDWVCLVQNESSFDTRKMRTNPSGSKDWGIFQINDEWWCDPEDGRKSYNSCKVACSDLATDDITQAVRCAQLIKRRRGFKPWNAWNQKCQRGKQSVDECF